MKSMEMESLATREGVVKDLCRQFSQEVGRKYGPLQPGQPVPESFKYYHNKDHTDDVVDAVILICDALIEEGLITRQEAHIAILAAAAHDLFHDYGHGDNEERSAQELAAWMKEAGIFSEDEISRASTVLTGTKIWFDKNGVMYQAAENSGDILAKALADADLSALGKNWDKFWQNALNLEREITGKTAVNINEGFLKREKKFLEGRRYFLPQTQHLFPHMAENLDYVEASLASRQHQV